MVLRFAVLLLAAVIPAAETGIITDPWYGLDPTPQPPRLLFCCAASNDIYQAVVTAAQFVQGDAQKLLLQRVDAVSCTAAAALLPNRSGVLLLADDAPLNPAVLPDGLLGLCSERYIRVFVEYAIPTRAAALSEFGVTGRTPCPSFNRVVADPASALWNDDSNTQPLDILEPNACFFMSYSAAPGSGAMLPHLVLAKVAGFTSAVFTLNGTKTLPVLVSPAHHPGLMLSALPLSSARRARYSPIQSWIKLWRDLLRWLMFHDRNASAAVWTDAVQWRAVVEPSFTATEPLPASATKAAVQRSLKWTHTTSGLLATPEALTVATDLGLWTQGLLKGGWPSELAPLSGNGVKAASGNGSSGVFEAFLSAIQPRSGGGLGGPLSTQLTRPIIRTDCVGEAAGGLAVGSWAEFSDPKAKATAKNLLDFLFFNSSAAAAWPRNDPSSAVGGTLLWGTNVQPPHASTIYADDQCRIGMAVAFAGAVMGETRWDESLMHLVLGNVRLMNAAGYFHSSITADAVVQQGWRHFFTDTSHNENNYYQSAGRAMMLMAHVLTCDETGLFLNRTKAGLASTMQAYYQRDWVCQVGLTSESARVLLPLAWLVRIEDTA